MQIKKILQVAVIVQNLLLKFLSLTGFSTYTILAQPGSGIISVNGAAAHKAKPGDKLVICAYVDVSEDQLKKFKPILVYLDDDNKIIKKTASIAMQLVWRFCQIVNE